MDYLNPLNYVAPSTKRIVTSLSMEAFAYAVVATSSVIQNTPGLTKNVAYAVNKTAGIAANLVDIVYPAPTVPQPPTRYYDIPVGTELQGKFLA